MTTDAIAGARNLLVDCAQAKPGDRLLIAFEPPSFGYYEADALECLVAAARGLGTEVATLDVGFVPEAPELTDELLDAVRAADRPSFMFGATATNSRSELIAPGNAYDLSVKLNVPIYSGYAATNRVRAAEAQVETRRAQRDRLQQQVALDVWNAYQNLQTASQSLRSTADLVNSAEQSERAASARYKAGAGNLLDVLVAQSALASAHQQRVQATYSWNIYRATLAQAMGSLDVKLLSMQSDRTQPTPEKPQP